MGSVVVWQHTPVHDLTPFFKKGEERLSLRRILALLGIVFGYVAIIDWLGICLDMTSYLLVLRYTLPV
jgi:hypothetical protein